MRRKEIKPPVATYLFILIIFASILNDSNLIVIGGTLFQYNIEVMYFTIVIISCLTAISYFAGNTSMKQYNTTFSNIFSNRSYAEQAVNVAEKKVKAYIHEIKTPIATIQGYTFEIEEILKEDKEIDKEFIKQSLKIIKEESDRILINLKNVNEAYETEKELNKTSFDINKMIKVCIEGIEKRGKTITFTPAERRQNVFADKSKIHEVITNLLSNAVYFSHSEIDMWIENGDEFIKILIKNDGPDICESFAKKMWDDGKTGRESTGKGLFLVSNFLNRHDVDFGYINNNPGVTFYFELDKG